MDKKDIKNLLRENLLTHLSEQAKPKAKRKAKAKPEAEEYDDLSSKEKKLINTKTIEIRNATGPGTLISVAGAMEASGYGPRDNATKRSELGKKLKGERHLTAAEADALLKVIKNPTAY